MDGAATSSGEKKSKSRREAECRDLLLVRHAVPKINSLGEKEKEEKKKDFYGFIKELEQLMERAQKMIHSGQQKIRRPVRSLSLHRSQPTPVPR